MLHHRSGWFGITSSDKGSTSPIIPSKNSSPESILRMDINVCLPQEDNTISDLEWIIKIPDHENINTDVCNAINQPMLFKKNTFP